MDALSDVLDAIKLSGVIFLRAELRGRFGISMPPPTISHPMIEPLTDEHRLVMFHVVREGGGFVEVEGFDARRIEQGDLLIVFGHLGHSVVDQPGRDAIPSAELVPRRAEVAAPPAVEVGQGEGAEMRLLCGMLQFVDRGFTPLVSALPPFLHIGNAQGPSTDWLQANVGYIIDEAETGRPGGERLLAGLTELLFIETLRSYLDSVDDSERGWFAALKDPVVGRAVQLIHETPAHAWTVAELARRSGASRSAFSARFSELLGDSPMSYVTRWRVRLATDLLVDSEMSVAEVAGCVGYESESAFSRAFKREMGEPPAGWRARRR